MNENQNEELQSRREFFKKAARAAIPVLGAIYLSPILSGCESSEPGGGGTSTGCKASCHVACRATSMYIPWSCNLNCKGACYSCKSLCYGTTK